MIINAIIIIAGKNEFVTRPNRIFAPIGSTPLGLKTSRLKYSKMEFFCHLWKNVEPCSAD